jgi:hypothetical protein
MDPIAVEETAEAVSRATQAAMSDLGLSGWIVAFFAAVSALTTLYFSWWNIRRRRPRPAVIGASAAKPDGCRFTLYVSVANPGDVPLVMVQEPKPKVSAPEAGEYVILNHFLSRPGKEKDGYGDTIPACSFEKLAVEVQMSAEHKECTQGNRSLEWYPKELQLRIFHHSGDRPGSTAWHLVLDSNSQRGKPIYQPVARWSWYRMRVFGEGTIWDCWIRKLRRSP